MYGEIGEMSNRMAVGGRGALDALEACR